MTQTGPAKKPKKKVERITRVQLKQARGLARATYAKLRAHHPDAHCELDHKDPFTLLVATVLSAQTTDVLVNKVTPHLFARYPDAPTLAAADPADVGRLMRERGLGMYNQKSKNIVGLARGLMERHKGQVPRTLAELILLPGVGRKTANVVLNTAFGEPAMAVDTHIFRVSNRTRIAPGKNVDEVERKLLKFVPKEFLHDAHHWLILHGRYTCVARKPKCWNCIINDLCEYKDKTPTPAGA